MYTQLAGNLANLFQSIGSTQDAQLALQSFANCWQALRTNGPITATGTSKPPRGGMFTSFPNEGTGQWDQYPGNSWNPRSPTSPPTNDGNYWGGDTYYGDTNLTNNFTTNLGDWYQKTFIDNSYNDFSTLMNVTPNYYNQQVNNFAGDNYFDNTTTTNNTTNNNVTNLGDVINLGDTINEGDVINKGDTILNENTFFVTNEGNRINIQQFIANVVVQILVGGGGANPPPINIPRLRGIGKVNLPEYTLNEEDCSISPKAKEVTVDVQIVRA